MNIRIFPVILLAVAIGALAPLLPNSNAALPLTEISRFQEAAPEKVSIEITDFKRVEAKVKRHFVIHFHVTAKVVAVERSGSDLKVGDVIEIRYTNPDLEKSPAAGDWPSTVVAGTTYLAHLSHSGAADGKNYEPAAHSGSFEPDDPEE